LIGKIGMSNHANMADLSSLLTKGRHQFVRFAVYGRLQRQVSGKLGCYSYLKSGPEACFETAHELRDLAKVPCHS
jgi:hypothetical protein